MADTKVIPLLDLRREYEYMKDEIDNAIRRCLDHQKWILGPEVKELEERVAQYTGVEHCIGVSSGTDALVLSLRALAIKLKGREYFDSTDQIITTPFTFTATGDAILRAGATPVFVDIDPRTYNIDPRRIRDYLSRSSELDAQNSKAVGVIPVHLYGQSCDMGRIMEIAQEHDLFVIEDVAQAFGGMWGGKKLGSFGTAGAFSFFPSKNLGGFGDGGMVSTADGEVAELVRMLLKHGGRDKYNVDHVGYNMRLDTLQASILLVKLKFVDRLNRLRRATAEAYQVRLANIPGLMLPTSLPDAYHVYHQYTVSTETREELQRHLTDRGIATMVYYPCPLHKMKVFGGRSVRGGALVGAELASSSVLSLPHGPFVEEAEISSIIGAMKEFQRCS